MVTEYYDDERYCENCKEDTWHSCRDSTHERDSSDDYQECKKCGWWMTGYMRKYHPPG